MRITKEAEYLLDRYMLSVSRRLPLRQRKDITEELRSSILDEIESRYPKDMIEEEMVEKILIEFGAPGKLAGSYRGEEWIIGPRLYPLFRMIFLIVSIVVTALGLIQMGISLPSYDLVSVLGKFVDLFASLMTALGFLILAFYIIQRTTSKTDWNEELYDDWSISELPEIETRTPVKLWEQVFSMIFSLLIIILLNGFHHRIGARYSTGNSCVFIPIFEEGFISLLPYLTVRWLLSIVLAAILIWKRVERFGTSIFTISLSSFDIAIAIIFIQGRIETFFNVDGLMVTPLASVVQIFKVMFYIVLAFIIIATIVEIVKKVQELLKYPIIEGK